MVRIISKEEEREDPRRDSSIYLRVQNTVVFPHFYKNYTKSNIPTSFPVIPCYSTYRINSSTRILQEILQLQGSSRADHYKASSSNCSPCIQAFYMAESSHKAPYSIPGPYSTSRLPVILPGRNSILHGSQHPRSPYSSSQAHSYKNSTRRNRILSKRVKYCISNTILRSVCSNLLITRILILSRVLVIPCEEITIYLQSKLS